MSTIMKIMGFCPKMVWVMGYHRIMGFGCEIPTNQLGGPKNYGFSEVMGYHKFGL